ncbi:hypothetical protein Scep_027606 [Stephania cephalantha]|uniref:Uncharacterized protein n=1 Tax=Stephania cephalantha TaxID=152367 RepID=A0AAP0EGP5_9MAGN
MDGACLSQPQPPPPPPPPPHDQQQPPQIDLADPPQQQDNVEREMQDWLTRDEQLGDTYPALLTNTVSIYKQWRVLRLHQQTHIRMQIEF